METDRLDAAEADYRDLLNTFPDSYRAYRGQGELALRRKDTNAAILCFEQYLSKTDADTPEAKYVAARLKSLQQGRR